MTFDVTLVAVFMLVLARMGGWVIVTPLLGSRTTTVTGRIALTVSLSLALTVPAAANAEVPTTMGLFLQAVLVQFLFGAAFGFVTGLMLYAAQIAGSIADMVSGLGYAAVVDPASGQQASVFSRLFSITFIALMFASSAYLTVIYGLGQTFEVVPVGPTVPFDPAGVEALAQGVADLLRAAVIVASPILGVMLLTEVALAIAARFFPQANVAFLGLGLKALLALTAAGVVLIWLPSFMDGFIAAGIDLAEEVFS